MFDKLAKHYDLIMSPFDYRELADCLDDLIIQSGGKRTDILDLGCGTSEELYYLMQLGYDISGIDMSGEMIQISKKKIPHGDFKKGDMRKFRTPKKYDNVISVFDTVNYLTKPSDLQSCFESVNRSLNKNGLFLFDFNSIHGLYNDWNGVKIEETDDFFISYESEFDLNTLILKCNMRFFIRDENGKYDSFTETHYERGYSPEDIIQMLKQTGFGEVKILPFLSRKTTKSTKLGRYQVAAKKTKEV
jgi:ubiquinone/menaquinone biosynthesis C-methylase UbiE